MTDDIDAYSKALDEIFALRLLLVREARVLEAHLDYRTFPKSRRRFGWESVERMREAARGRVEVDDRRMAKDEYWRVTGMRTMTRWQWEAEKAGGE